MIEPTVGRVVWFLPDGPHQERPPLAATIAAVNDDGTINIGYLTPEGKHHNECSVPLFQDEEGVPPRRSFCMWTPYQVGQAKKTEEAQELQAAAEQGFYYGNHGNRGESNLAPDQNPYPDPEPTEEEAD